MLCENLCCLFFINYFWLVFLILENQDLNETEKIILNKKLKEREEYLEPVYHQVAVHFADLHDTPGGMLAKGCISVSF